MTESELQINSQQNLFQLEMLYKNDKKGFFEMADYLPILITMSNVDSLNFNFCNKMINGILNVEKEFAIEYGWDCISKTFVHPSNLLYQKEILSAYNIYHENSIITYYQSIKKRGYHDYYWVHTNKKFLDEKTYISSYFDLKNLGNVYYLLREYLGDIGLSTRAFQRFQSLTNKEKSILKTIIQGESNKQIAEKSYISINTVRTHRNRIWKKLDIKHFKDCLKYQLMYNDIEV